MKAQPTLTHTNFVPLIGESQLYYIADTNTVLDNTNGANVIFDYTGMHTYGQVQTLYFVDPTTTASTSDFLSATTADTTGGVPVNMKYNQDFTDSLDIIGLVLNINTFGTVIAKFDANPEIIMKFPFNYGDSFSDDYGGEFTSAAAPIPTNGNGTVTVTADGWGTLKLPMGVNIDSVLRIVQIENLLTDTIFLQPFFPDIMPIPINATQINYYKPSLSKNPLVSYTIADVNGDTTISVLSQYPMFLVGIKEIKDAVNVSLFPNPTKGDASLLSFKLENNGLVKVNLVNTLGQHIKSIFEGNLQKGQHQFSIKTSNLAKGLYYVEININGEKTVKKLVVE
ncbi:MAG: hypothetical protein A3K10_09525 [Bacteroidetes bacterium RIFCSPLOWO2_12_FULL_31_6]|nr:MAG: hypothetical protein A3K10_09525 [Bacteroidetes bacterium RIFCSPLOWO2_12_FULL_31_6]